MFILPGQKIHITQLISQNSQIENVKIDQDLETDYHQQITSRYSGELLSKTNKQDLVLGIRKQQSIYQPQKEDQIVGIVKGKLGEYYVLDLGNHQECYLGIYEFEGATKKNRPVLKDGQLVYCKIKKISQYMKPKSTCKSKLSKKEWMTGEAYYGELKEGMLVHIDVNKSVWLEKNGDQVFTKIAKLCQFEVVVGVNGKVWIKARELEDTVVIYNLIKVLEKNDFEQVDNIVEQYKGFFQVNQKV